MIAVHVLTNHHEKVGLPVKWSSWLLSIIHVPHTLLDVSPTNVGWALLKATL
jgi:hypothetical protein